MNPYGCYFPEPPHSSFRSSKFAYFSAATDSFEGGVLSSFDDAPLRQCPLLYHSFHKQNLVAFIFTSPLFFLLDHDHLDPRSVRGSPHAHNFLQSHVARLHDGEGNLSTILERRSEKDSDVGLFRPLEHRFVRRSNQEHGVEEGGVIVDLARNHEGRGLLASCKHDSHVLLLILLHIAYHFDLFHPLLLVLLGWHILLADLAEDEMMSVDEIVQVKMLADDVSGALQYGVYAHRKMEEPRGHVEHHQ
mmetsp:Transcript_22010/g.65166  ORF Transcript_22010/g.65166 Transcript_22010/m.65166 type:complete len:247 (+) Transcript_22010:397-1137(+)